MNTSRPTPWLRTASSARLATALPEREMTAPSSVRASSASMSTRSQHGVEVDPAARRVDAFEQLVDVDPLDHLVDVDRPHDAGDDLVRHRLDELAGALAEGVQHAVARLRRVAEHGVVDVPPSQCR